MFLVFGVVRQSNSEKYSRSVICVSLSVNVSLRISIFMCALNKYLNVLYRDAQVLTKIPFKLQYGQEQHPNCRSFFPDVVSLYIGTISVVLPQGRPGHHTVLSRNNNKNDPQSQHLPI